MSFICHCKRERKGHKLEILLFITGNNTHYKIRQKSADTWNIVPKP